MQYSKRKSIYKVKGITKATKLKFIMIHIYGNYFKGGEIMKRITTFVMMFLFAGIGYINAQTVQKEKEMTREEEKAQKEMLDQLYYEEAKKAIEEKQFILEADQVMFK